MLLHNSRRLGREGSVEGQVLGPQPHQCQRERLFVATCRLLGLSGAVTVLGLWGLRGFDTTTLVATVAWPFISLLPFVIFRRFKNYYLSVTLQVSVLATALAAIAFFRGGLLSPVFVWFAVLPLLAFALLRRRTAKYVTGAMCLVLCAFLAAHLLGYPFEISHSPLEPLVYFLCVVPAVLVAFAFAVSWEAERRRAYRELADREQRMAESQRLEALGRLAGGVAHDFNNILTVVETWAYVLQSELERPDRDEDFKAIFGGIHRAQTLADQLLAYSRRQVLAPGPVDVCEVLGTLHALLDRALGSNIAFEFEIDPHTPPIHVDAVKFEQVVLNLVLNARDAMPGGGHIFIHAEPQQRGERDGVLLRVCDTGEGIDPQVQPHVFEPFFTTKEPGRGTGLGLSTVYGIVTQSDGAITLHSAPGDGTTFEVWLPAARPEIVKSRSSNEAEASPLRVLYVEDDEDVRGATLRLLQLSGHTVFAVGDAARALDALCRNSGEFDVLLSDVVMPRENGIELVRVLRDRGVQLPAVLTSGHAAEELTDGSRLPDGCTFLAKPFTAHALDATLQSAFAEARSPGTSEARLPRNSTADERA